MMMYSLFIGLSRFITIVVCCVTIADAQVFPNGFSSVSVPTTASIQRFIAHNTTFFALTSSGVFQTNTSGQDWRQVSINGQNVQILNSFNNRLYARVDSNVYFVSIDNAATWSPSPVQLAEYAVSSSSALLKIKNGQLQRSTDAGITWSGIFTNDVVSDVVVFQSKFYVAKTGRMFEKERSGCFVSSDGGISWQQLVIQESVNRFDNPLFLRGFCILPNNTLVATVNLPRVLVSTYCSSPRSRNFYRLKDSVWESISSGISRFTKPDEIYVYGKNILALGWGECNDSQWSNGGLFTSFDAEMWNPTSLGWGAFTAPCNDCIAPTTIGVSNEGIVFIAGERILDSGPPALKTTRQPVLLRSVSSIATSVATDYDRQSVIISPNPASSNVTIQGKAEHTGIVTVRLANSIGETLLIKRISVNEKIPYQYNLDIQQIPVGMYLVEVEENNFEFKSSKTTRKLVKQ
jgi:photosystem II stability/assembly factor-like uncharacterized protein